MPQAKVFTFSLHGVEAVPIEVEIDVTHGLPSFDIVGLPDMAVKESRERVRSAIKNSGYSFPLQRITINLAPADLRKAGSSFDLPIALGILVATDQVSNEITQNWWWGGELALDGSIRPIPGIIAMALAVSKSGQERGISYRFGIPNANFREAALVLSAGIAPVNSLLDFRNFSKAFACPPPLAFDADAQAPSKEFDDVAFHNIRGQESTKRALEIAAAGGHHLMMVGPPGSGKTLLARSMTSILPSMTHQEKIEVSQIYSVVNLLPPGSGLIQKRPFRAPHHTCSTISLVGGGRIPRPGEISLAHHGVLFLDELLEFNRDVLESLRQPLDDGMVTITRLKSVCKFPCSFLLIAAMNPCPCGYLGDPSHDCTCTQRQISRYQQRVSGPLLDRFDLQVEVPRIDPFAPDNTAQYASIDIIRKRIDESRQLQRNRLEPYGINCNARMNHSLTENLCRLDRESKQLLTHAYKQFGLSMRAHHKLLRISRTIADLAGDEQIASKHVAEAIQYRCLDRNRDW